MRGDMPSGRVLFLAAAPLRLSGGAAIRGHEAGSTEQLRAAAGSQIPPADTPERAHDLAVMPPLKIVARTQDNDVRYTFADPYKCRCLYIGGSKAYSAQHHLVTEQPVGQQPRRAREDSRKPHAWGAAYW